MLPGRQLQGHAAPTLHAPIAAVRDNRSLLRRAIARSGLTQGEWAREIAWRDARTVRRWLAGDSPVPEAVAAPLRRQEMEAADLRQVALDRLRALRAAAPERSARSLAQTS